MQTNTKRIAKNTLMLYFRQILIMVVSLYTVRVVLGVLGAEDYGIYNVVAGVVTMFSFLTGAMATASQRFFSYEIGRGNTTELKNIFATTLLVYALLSVVIILLAETVGLWFVNNKLVIPENRFVAAKCIFHCAVASFLFDIMSTPYMSAIIAHENMDFYAYLSIIEAVLKLVIVFILQIIKIDKLVLYGLLHLAVSFVIMLSYMIYSRKKYAECRFKFLWNKNKLKEMFSYIGFDLYGNLAVLLRTQGVNFLINMFFTAVMNAAGAIATSVQNAVVSFASNLLSAFRPQIVKQYAAANYDEMVKLIRKAAIITTYLLLLFSIPLSLEIDYVLKLWLKNVPAHASSICVLLLCFSIFANLSSVCMTGIHATGHIKRSSFINGTLYIIVIPASYIGYKLGFPVEFSYFFNVLMVICGMIHNVFILNKFVKEFSKFDYIIKIILPYIIICVFICLGSYLFVPRLESSFFRLCLTTFYSTILLSTFTYFCILNFEEKFFIKSKIKGILGEKK